MQFNDSLDPKSPHGRADAPIPRPLRGYAAGLVLVAASIVIRLLLDPVLGVRFPFATVFFAVLATAWYGGFGPAIFATFVGAAASVWFLLPPRHSWLLNSDEDVGGLILYLVVGVGIASIGGAMRRAQRLAEKFGWDVEKQREELKVTLQGIGDGVITTDATGRVMSMNVVAVELTGWRAEDAAGRQLTEVFHIINEESREKVENPVEKVLAEGRIVGLANHTLLVAKDGSERPIDDSAAPIRDGAGRMIGVVLVFRDVTERRHAEEELRLSEGKLSDFFENANIGLHWVSPEGIILRANQAELDMLGYQREEYVGRPIKDFHADANAIDAILTEMVAGRSLRNRAARMRAKDGAIKNVLINSSVYTELGRVVHSRCFTLDVTDRTRAYEAESLLASVVKSSSDAVVTKTLEGRITSWNAGAERILGYSAEETIGQSIMMVIPADRQSEETSFLERLRRGERIDSLDTVRIAKGGREVHVSLTISPIRDPEGNVVGASKVARDITESRLAAQAVVESEERFRTMADNIAQIAWMADPGGKVFWLNQRWYEFSGLTPDQMRDFDRRSVIHPDHYERVMKRLQHCWDTGVPYDDAFPLRGADGKYHWFLSRSVPIRDDEGRITRWFGTNTDITELREAEEALRHADQRKDEFLATLAHELRNPLAPVRSALEIMKRAGQNAELITQARMTIDRQMSHFERLVDDLLDVSRITRDKLELRRERVELDSVIHQAVEAARPLLEHMGHELTLSLAPRPIYVQVDAVRLAQVLSNLLNNACKYTDRGGKITLAVTADADHVTISVKDNGRGISAELLPSVFEMFTQLVRPIEPSHGGLGIGLTLVRRLVEMHGGTVEAQSAGLGQGSEFRVRLPLDQAAPPATKPSRTAPAAAAAGSKRILVVDDNRDAAQTLAMLLKISGHETRLAHDGLEAVEVAGEFLPHLALVDIGLPKLSGHEVARRIRSEPWGRAMCLAALTGWGQEEDRRKSSDAGFDHHLVKPVHNDALTELIASLPK